MTVSRENLTTWLRDAYAMENEAIEIFKKQVSRLEHYPELRAKVSSHLDELHRQAERVERCLHQLGADTSGLKTAIGKMVGTAQQLSGLLPATKVRERHRRLRLRALRDRVLQDAHRPWPKRRASTRWAGFSKRTCAKRKPWLRGWHGTCQRSRASTCTGKPPGRPRRSEGANSFVNPGRKPGRSRSPLRGGGRQAQAANHLAGPAEQRESKSIRRATVLKINDSLGSFGLPQGLAGNLAGPTGAAHSRVPGKSRPSPMMRLFGWFLLLALIVLIPFLIWGSCFERSFSQEGTVAWLTGFGPWASLAGILLLMSDLILPIPATAVMAALGFLYGPLAGGLIATLGSFLSGALAYLLCRRFGRPAAARLLGPQELVEGERLFARAGGWLVVLSRWLPVFPEVIACMAGLSGMRPIPFFAALALRLGTACLRVCRDRSCRRRPPGPGDCAQRRPAAAALAQRPALFPGEAVGAGRRRARGPGAAGMTNKPTDRPVDPGELPRLARAVIAADRFPFLATVDQDRPRLRPSRRCALTASRSMSPACRVTTRPESSRPIRQSSSPISPPITTRYGSPGGPRSSLTGCCSPRSGPRTRCCDIISARSRIPELIVYRIVPERVRFMREWSLAYHDVSFEATA